ncbi:uncharacterized protein SCHCODRAFT_02671756 [Schizophyllum commune H4-8]|nr:uncharacterized protein SCHCODRAFT_02671756 [Schizophyllum commune H4-8]KAI5887804.1 hypothetical protein SCHCODRAFT_02671756 [Schizophyllum commune H4-8]
MAVASPPPRLSSQPAQVDRAAHPPLTLPFPPLLRSWRIAFVAIFRIAGDASRASRPPRCAVCAADCSCAQRVNLSAAARPAPLAPPLRAVLRREEVGRWGYVLPRPCARLDYARGSRGGAVAPIAGELLLPAVLATRL